MSIRIPASSASGSRVPRKYSPNSLNHITEIRPETHPPACQAASEETTTMSKTVSLKQLLANRLNAMKSTGPKTEEGKNKARINGQRHGLTGAAMLMTDEDRAAYEAFSEPLIASLKPGDPFETSFAQLIAQAHFRLNRIHAIEENTFAMGHYNQASAFEADNDEVHNCVTHARVFDMKGNVFRNLSLYEQRISREMHKNLKALKELQDRRKAQEREDARQVALEAAKPKARAASASTASEENGFGFSCVETAPQPTAETPPQQEKKAA